MTLLEKVLARKKIVISILVLGLLIFGGVYATHPNVEASVDSVVFGYDGGADYQNPQELSPSQNIGSFEYSLQYETEDGQTVTESGQYNETQQRLLLTEPNSQRYRVVVEGGRQTYYRSTTDSGFQLFGQRGMSVVENDSGVEVVRVISLSEETLDGAFDATTPNVRMNGSAIWIADSKFRQVGEKEYQNRSVDVFRKVNSGGAGNARENPATLYIDQATGTLIYLNGPIDFATPENETDLRNVSYNVNFSTDTISAPAWTEKPTIYGAEDIEYINLQSQSRFIEGDRNAFVLSAVVKPKPIQLNETVNVTIEDKNQTIVSETVMLGDLLGGVAFTDTGTIELNSIDESDEEVLLLSELDNPTVTITTANNSFKFTNVKSGTQHQVTNSHIESNQTVVNASISRNEDTIQYTLHDYYEVASPFVIDYGEQSKQFTDETAFTYPKPENTTATFNNTGQATHFALHGPDMNRVVLQPVDRESRPTGTIAINLYEMNATVTENTTLELRQAGITVARVNSISDADTRVLYITNVPIGEYQVHMQTNTAMVYRVVTVSENEESKAERFTG